MNSININEINKGDALKSMISNYFKGVSFLIDLMSQNEML